ncbi:putative membrane protein [Escherichia phage 2725-N35]|uniref:Putative membrane protein n=1 Tax=Escherichia phage 2725-N35 TaxID=2692738 RepID=A0A6B9SUJ6_9CAUD|nr:putative membrane protein [Escherichia phage 2725-N35]
MLKRIAALVMCLALSGCSATDALTGLIGSKPEISAQAGAENNKVGVGLTNKVDSSSSSEATVKDSKVGSLDSSSGKKTADNSIKASTITAEKIEITNNESSALPWVGTGAMGLLVLILMASILRRKKAS